MKTIIFACLLAVAAARPDKPPRPSYGAPADRRAADSAEVVPILRDDRHLGEDGAFSTDTETGDGIKISHSGARLAHVEEQPVGHQGSVAFTFPDGEKFDLKFVADENGYQPESSWLPVAPEFPHPIPQFVLDQIEKAAKEDEEKAREDKNGNGKKGYN